MVRSGDGGCKEGGWANVENTDGWFVFEDGYNRDDPVGGDA